MKFQVPQFIDVEDKIFGPFTLKQFIYLAGGGGLVFVFYELFPLFIAMFFIIPTALFSLALAFYQINNRPFITVLESAFKFSFTRRLYVWKKKEKSFKKKEEVEEAEPFVPRLSESKLKDIAWSLDVQESIYAGEERRGN